MQLTSFPFQLIDWRGIPKEEYPGITGTAQWQVFNMGEIRIRMVKYTAGYSADHWCHKGHIIYYINGEMETELQDGRKFILSKGMTYHVGDNSNAHRSASVKGCKLLIID